MMVISKILNSWPSRKKIVLFVFSGVLETRQLLVQEPM